MALLSRASDNPYEKERAKDKKCEMNQEARVGDAELLSIV